jgi:hypothetical protein
VSPPVLGVVSKVRFRIFQSSPSRITVQYPLASIGPKFWPLTVALHTPVAQVSLPLSDIVADAPFLEEGCKRFFDGTPTANRSCVRHKNRVLCEERGRGSGIVVGACVAKPLALRAKLLIDLPNGFEYKEAEMGSLQNLF